MDHGPATVRAAGLLERLAGLGEALGGPEGGVGPGGGRGGRPGPGAVLAAHGGSVPLSVPAPQLLPEAAVCCRVRGCGTFWRNLQARFSFVRLHGWEGGGGLHQRQ